MNGEALTEVNMERYLERSLTYAEYIALIDELLLQGRTTGPDGSEKMFNYGRLNRQRMKRLGNTVGLSDEVAEKVRRVGRPMIWLIITEGWCGDAAQSIPVVEKIARENELIETRYILRDENPELMDRYLTNGTRSIPKLIALDAATLEELGTWGPRPKEAMDYFYEMRESGMAKHVMSEHLQRWYNQDRQQAIQEEFAQLLENWSVSDKRPAVGV